MVAAKHWILPALFLVLQTIGSAYAEQQPIRPGDPFPEMNLPTPAETADQEYLQLSTGKTFTPSEIKADVLLIELLNIHCPHCQMQAPAYNNLFKLIEKNQENQGKIKMLGLAVGNLPGEVDSFRKNYQVEFPILADPNFTAWRAIGGSSTPLTIYVRQDQPGQPGIVNGIHRGMNTHYQELHQRLTEMATQDPVELRKKARKIVESQLSVQPIHSEPELEFRVRTAFAHFGQIEDFSKLAMLSGRQVYTALIDSGQSLDRLFAEVTSRSSVCDICHDVHFIYLFDRSTKLIGFEPLQLTKYGNINWGEREVEIMRKKVLGRYLAMPQPFDPKLDAITSATMTSAIIFDSLAQGEELIRELRSQGLM